MLPTNEGSHNIYSPSGLSASLPLARGSPCNALFHIAWINLGVALPLFEDILWPLRWNSPGHNVCQDVRDLQSDLDREPLQYKVCVAPRNQ